MKLSRFFAKTGLAILVVLTVLLAVRTVFNITEGRKLARTLTELKEKGVPLSTADLAPACKDEDNAARLWKAAESLLLLEDEDKTILSRAFHDVIAGKPLDPSHQDAMTAMIEKNEPALQLARAMSGKPCFLYRDPELPFRESMMPVDSSFKMISAARLLGVEALMTAENGNVTGAVEHIRTALGFSSKIAGEGFLITHLVAVANTRMLLSFLAGICNGRDVDDEALLRLLDSLEPEVWRMRLVQSIAGERTLNLEWSSDLIRGKVRAAADEKLFRRLASWVVRPFQKTEAVRTIVDIADLASIAERPYFEQRRFFGTDTENSSRLSLSAEIAGHMQAAFLKNAILEANLRVARTGLACKLFKNRTGEYPENLEALVPGILEEIPLDPFTGAPLVYRRDEAGFIVYSLGSNERDDGGRSTYMTTQLVMEKDDDWSWKEPF